MAKFTAKALVLLLILSLVLISTVESKRLGIGFGEVKSAPDCDSAYGAEDGDICTSVAQKFGLTLEFFISINPNINCDDIFVGQWLCVDGSV